jgi:hypothetical protein
MSKAKTPKNYTTQKGKAKGNVDRYFLIKIRELLKIAFPSMAC